MNESDVFHVAVMPPDQVNPELISRVGEIVSQPEYQIRLLLAGRRPRIIGHFRDEAASAAAVQKLKDIGLKVFGVRESELRRTVIPRLIARSVKIEGDSAIFTNRDGKTEMMKAAEVFLIITGRRIRMVGEAAVETSKMKVNLPATLLSGGIPIMKRVTSKNEEPRKVTEQFIRLYRLNSDDPAVEITQFDFDYSFLAGGMGPTATGNIAATAAAMRQWSDRAYFNDSLLSGFVAESRSISGIDLGEKGCLLLVRYYRSLV